VRESVRGAFSLFVIKSDCMWREFANGQELIRYDLGEDFSIETAVVVGELYRNNGEWKFNAIGSAFPVV